MGKKIKSVRQKIGNNEFDLPISLGADGKNVDMESGLDLEEEFKMGGVSDVDITEDELGATIIVERFYDKAGTLIGTVESKIEDSEDPNGGDPVSLMTIGTTMTKGEKVFSKQTVLASTASLPDDVQVREHWV